MATMITAREDRTTAGLLTMAVGVLLLNLIDTSGKWLALAGVPVIQIVFVRFAVHFGLALAVTLPQTGTALLRSRAPLRQFLRAVFLLLSTSFLVLALRDLPITLNTAIIFAMPIVVSLLAIPMLGERVGLHRLASVCVGFLGVLVVTQPWGAGFHPAMLYSLAGVCTGALYFILTRMLAGVDENATSQLWSSGLASLCLMPFAIGVWVWPQSPVDWAFFALIGIFGASAHTLVTAAHRLADASVLAPVLYVQLLFATISGVVFFDTWPTMSTLFGAAIIIGSGIYIWHREHRAA